MFITTMRHLIVVAEEPTLAGRWSSIPAPIEDEISVNAYLDTTNREIAAQVFDALDKVAQALGYEGSYNESIQLGSFWRRATAKLVAGLTSKEVRQRLIKVERALDLRQVDGHQADVDLRTSQAVAHLASSLEAVPQACLRVG